MNTNQEQKLKPPVLKWGLLPDCQARLQSRPRPVHRLPRPGAPARLHQSCGQRLARGVGGPRAGVGVHFSRITAVWKLAIEAADSGLLARELADGMARVKSAKPMVVRTRNGPSLKQAQALLNAPDITTTKGCAAAPSSPSCPAAAHDGRKRQLMRWDTSGSAMAVRALWTSSGSTGAGALRRCRRGSRRQPMPDRVTFGCRAAQHGVRADSWSPRLREAVRARSDMRRSSGARPVAWRGSFVRHRESRAGSRRRGGKSTR